MDVTYSMIGVDGAQYGPITLQQLRTWVSEGRVDRDTQIMRSDSKAWLPAAQFEELGMAPPAHTTPPPMVASVGNQVLERRVRLGARWFFWIAGLLAINTYMAMTRGNFIFAVGLATTRIIDGFGARTNSGNGQTIALVLNGIVAGIFVLLGAFAWKRQSWSFMVGLVLYAFDAILLLLVGADVISVAFHGLVLFGVIRGLMACLQLKKSALASI